MNARGNVQALLRAAVEAVEKRLPGLRRQAVKPAREAAAPAVRRPGAVRIHESVRVLEAMKDGPNGEKIFKVVLISEGLGNLRNKNYYGPEAVTSSPKAFEGRWCYLDHQSVSEAEDLPERGVMDKAGFYKNLTETTDQGKRACGGELHCDLSESGKRLADKLASALLYKTHFPNNGLEYVGLSVNADGDAEPRTMDTEHGELEVNYVTAITEGDSCDLVTTPARGGRGLAVLKESAGGAQEAGMKKKLQAIYAVLTEAAKTVTGDGTKKLAEAHKSLAALVKEADVEPTESVDAMCAKREGESDEDHMTRLHALAKGVAKHLGTAAPAEAEEPEPEPEEREPDADATEAARDAVAGLIKESGMPKDFYTKDDLARLAKKPYREAKAEIAKDAKLAKTIRESFGAPVASLHRGLSESGTDHDAAFLEAARGE